MKSDTYTSATLITQVGVLAAAVLFFVPFVFVVLNSIKPYGEIVASAVSLPAAIEWENYLIAWQDVHFPRVLVNSLIITVSSLVGLILMGTMAAWQLGRNPGAVASTVLMLFVASMIVPFQSIMIPLMKISSVLGLLDSRWGLIVVYWGFRMPFTVFLFYGFVKTVPLELEQAAIIDGASSGIVFTRIVLPLLRPMVATVAIIHTLWIWNDFLLPLIMLFDRDLHTIPLAVYSFFGQWANRWDRALATLVMGTAPIITFFVILQRQLVSGIMSGSVKG